MLDLLLIAVGLSMDAFAVAICKGLSLKKATIRCCVTVGLYFGVFQALMPTIGYFVGTSFAEAIQAFDHWVVFGLLFLIGANMIREALSKGEEDVKGADLSLKAMLPLALATSIDALAVGVTFGLQGTSIALAAPVIGCVTFLISVAGVKVGSAFGAKYQRKAELLGGIILIGIGVKVLIEHLCA